MCYDRDSPQICRDIEHHHVDTAADTTRLFGGCRGWGSCIQKQERG